MRKIKAFLALFIILAFPLNLYADVAFDNYASSAAGTGDISFDITPVGTARAVIVFVLTNVEGDEITSATADGTAMTECTDSPALNTAGEDGGAHCFFLGSSVPTGTLTIAVTTSGTTTTKIAGAVTLTASADVEVVDTNFVVSNSDDNPAVTLSLASRTSFAMIGAWSGIGTGTAPFTNWTERLDHDFGNQTGTIKTYDIVSTTDVSAGYTAGADDVAMHAIAVSETAGGGSTLKKGAVLIIN